MMGGKILTPQDEVMSQALASAQPGAPGQVLMVNVNGENMPYALAMLMVTNELANATTRIAETLEKFADFHLSTPGERALKDAPKVPNA